MIGLGIFIGNYMIFIRNERYKKIEERFCSEDKKTRKIKGYLIVFYIIISFLMIFMI
jgi:hypothetical protein